jgi:hypothetical protein
LYPAVARRAGHRCEYFRAPEVVFNSTFEVEHVLPISLGGTDEPDNLALACRSCNGHKAAAVTAADPDTGEVVSLFNPRADRRGDHSRYDPDSGTVDGLTATGRATVARLDMNRPVQLAARVLWVQLRLFP